MPSGFQVFDANNVNIFDIDDQTVKFFGRITIGNSGTDTATGTITEPRFTAYTGHVPFVAELEGGRGSNLHYAAQLSISGNNLNWTFPFPGIRPRTQLLYGVIGRV